MKILTAETRVKGNGDELRQRTQEPGQHVRWDLRFTDIDYLPRVTPDNPQRFRYATRIGGGLRIEGWGETVAERGGRGSSLRFGSEDAKSLIREGSGCWVYEPDNGHVRFYTAYDYRVRYGRIGRLLDRLLFRPLMVWATRWSFDRLRLWIEAGTTPELSRRLWLVKVMARSALGLVWILEGLLPKLLFVAPEELDLVARSGMVIGSPSLTLSLVGVAEILGGLWLLSGKTERLTTFIAAIVTLVMSGLAIALAPTSLADPFGGIVKNVGLLVCSVVVLALAGCAPKAVRAKPRRTSQR